VRVGLGVGVGFGVGVGLGLGLSALAGPACARIWRGRFVGESWTPESGPREAPGTSPTTLAQNAEMAVAAISVNAIDNATESFLIFCSSRGTPLLAFLCAYPHVLLLQSRRLNLRALPPFPLARVDDIDSDFQPRPILVVVAQITEMREMLSMQVELGFFSNAALPSALGRGNHPDF
jgi:hypothetical protein